MLGIYEMFARRRCPCTLRCINPLIDRIIQKSVSSQIFHILKAIAHDMLLLYDVPSYMKTIDKKQKDAFESSLCDGDIILKLVVKESKSTKIINFDRNSALSTFQSHLRKYVEGKASTSLPQLFADQTCRARDNCSISTEEEKLDTSSFIDALMKCDTFDFKSKIVHRHHWSGRQDSYKSFPIDIFPNKAILESCLTRMKISRLYSHQVEAIEALVKDVKNVVVTTSTASGKSVTYIIPIINSFLNNHSITAFMMFPTKALAQDQLVGLRRWLTAAELDVGVSCYDGDTDKAIRSKIRAENDILLINPDILHLSILPYHKEWIDFFSRLKYLILDEAHMYRGAFGIHVSCIVRRLRRLAALYGANPLVIVCSATLSNAIAHAGNLTGIPLDQFVLIERDGSPCGEKEIVFYNPFANSNGCNDSTELISRDVSSSVEKHSSSNTQIFYRNDANVADDELLMASDANRYSPYENLGMIIEKLVKHRVRTLVFVKARYIAEHVLELARKRLPSELQPTVGAYRGGYMAADRRDIECKLKNGELLVVVTTNALELGIDVGSLDCTLHLGYPGSMSSFRQQAGRAGRAGQRSIAIYIALHSPLEQFFMTYPDFFFKRPVDELLLNVTNETILTDHLMCSVVELEFIAPDLSSSILIKDSCNAVSTHDDHPTSFSHIKDPTVWFGDTAHQLLAKVYQKGMLQTSKKLDYSVSSDTGQANEVTIISSASTYHPARDVCIRSADSQRIVSVVVQDTGAVIETMQYADSLLWLYEGAVHMHLGRTYEVVRLDLEKLKAEVVPCHVSYYTQHVGHIVVSITGQNSSRTISYGNMQTLSMNNLSNGGLSRDSVDSEITNVACTPAHLRVGPVNVTKQVHSYRVRDKRTSRVKETHEVNQPAFTFDSRAVWSDIPPEVVQQLFNIYCYPCEGTTTDSGNVSEKVPHTVFLRNGFTWSFDEIYMKFGLHAVEHILIALAPTLIPCDVSDLSCQHTRQHIDVNKRFMLLFETQRGGFGLVERLENKWIELLDAAFKLVSHCPCTSGCPSCCHISNCGDFNEHLDKHMAVCILALLTGESCPTLPSEELGLDMEAASGVLKASAGSLAECQKEHVVESSKRRRVSVGGEKAEKTSSKSRKK